MNLLLLLVSLNPLIQQYNAGNYEAVVARAESVLTEPGITRADSLRITKIHAFALVAVGRTRQAEEVFLRLLERYPNTELDPREVSPKIRAVFEEVKRQALSRPAPVRVDTVRLRQPVPLSVLVPGVSQLQAGRRARGYALLGATAISLAGLGLSHFSYQHARGEYLSATESQQVLDRYETANNWYRARTAFLGTTAIAWLASLLDAIRSQ